jgi:hypothetical protein
VLLEVKKAEDMPMTGALKFGPNIDAEVQIQNRAE